uniref:Uncharacterized protein n=1 Tax=Arundo donax TaxID=35708 RepID=A0A0A9HTZ9_ARUDO
MFSSSSCHGYPLKFRIHLSDLKYSNTNLYYSFHSIGSLTVEGYSPTLCSSRLLQLFMYFLLQILKTLLQQVVIVHMKQYIRKT